MRPSNGRRLARLRLGRLALLGAGLGLLLAVAPQAGSAADYLLGPQDRVRLKVYEWRRSRDEIFEWTALNDEFTVGADGSLALPFVGIIKASGREPGALAATISERLVRQMGLGQVPDVSVEVMEFRPFYITGHINNPGEFPYRPGLTVLKAVSLAGGLQNRDQELGRIDREIISGHGDLSLLSLSNLSLLARRARLEAELHDADEVEFPHALTRRTSDDIAIVLMEQERSIFETRRGALTTQARALTQLRSFLEGEAESLTGQLDLLDQQIESIQDELSNVTSLVEQGLAVAPRQIALERSLLQARSDRLSSESALLRARQETSRTDLDLLELRNRHANEVSVDLRETRELISEVARKSDTALMLLSDSELAAPRLLALRAQQAAIQPSYVIIRPDGAGTIEIDATETTEVEPGDSIKVELPLPALSGQPALGSAGPATDEDGSPPAPAAPEDVSLVRP